MLSLDTRSRAALAGAALLAFAAAIQRDPIAARGEPAALIRARHDVSSPLTPAPLIVPRRDPFDGEPAPTQSRPMPPAALPPVPALIGPLPPNAAVPAPGAPERVTAIVSGAHPYALLEAAGRTRVVTVGERVEGASVVAIGIDGVRLSGGKVLTIGAAAPAALSTGGSL